VRCIRSEWIPNDGISAGLLLVAALPWLVAIVEEAEILGGKIKFRELKRETEELRQSAKETRNRLDRLILASLSPRLVKELYDFANRVRGPVRHTNAYLQELWFLHNCGYIQFLPHCAGFDEIPRDRDIELLEYMEFTPLGAEYLNLRTLVHDDPDVAASNCKRILPSSQAS
jgi:hypothetical protein